MKRRSFLATSAAAAAGTQLLGGVPLRAFSPVQLMDTLDGDDDRVLIVIQLFGGNDGLNTVIPADDPEYYNLRPSISVPKEIATNVLSKVYLHPSLNPAGTYNLKTMFEDGRLAIVQGIGYENPNLSHFRSTDIWLSGFNSSDPNKRLIDGWLGRYWSNKINGFPETLPSDPTAVQIGGSLSMLLQSPKGDIGIALTDPEKFFELGQGLSPDLNPMPEDTRYGREFNFIRLVAEQSDRLLDRRQGCLRQRFKCRELSRQRLRAANAARCPVDLRRLEVQGLPCLPRWIRHTRASSRMRSMVDFTRT